MARSNSQRWRRDLGRARYSPGYVVLTATNLWQAHWFPYIRDPETGRERRVHKSRILGAKAQMKKYRAEEELRKITKPIAERNGVVLAGDATFGWFLENRWKPLRQWRDSTRQTNEELLAMLVARFGTTKLSDLDKVELQDWLNGLAKARSQSCVWHLRTFLKSICEEAVEQDFLRKDPARKLTRPHTRKPDETVLEWAEYQAVLGGLPVRDRLIVKVAGACAVRPEELFAFRWRSLTELPNGRKALLVAETVYRGEMRDFAKTEGSKDCVALPHLLAQELEEWRAATEYPAAEDFIFPNSRGGFIHKDNYLNRVLYPVRDALKLKRLNFQILRRTFATRAYGEGKGTLRDIQKHLRHAKPSTTLEHYAKAVPETVLKMVDAMYETMIAEPKGPVQ